MNLNTLVFINSKGKPSRSPRLSPAQLKFFKALSQVERGVWLNRLYQLESKHRPRGVLSIYDEDFKAPSIDYKDAGTPVDILDAVHESLKDLQIYSFD